MIDLPTRPIAAWSVGRDIAYPDTILPRLMLDQAARRPEAVAIRQWDDAITYGELAARSGALARQLADAGVAVEDRVGICMRRRPEMLVALLGVQRAGAAYVPLDPRGPGTQVSRILDDAAIDVVIVDDETADLCLLSARRRVRVPATADGSDPASAGPAGPDNAAYVLYTSGSTGHPKGVVVSHRSVVEFTVAWGAMTGVKETTRAFGFASLGFDASVNDFLVPMVAGGEVCLVGDDDRGDPERLQRFAVEHRVTWGFVPPPLLAILDPAGLPDWRLVFTGGEAPGPDQVLRWAGPAQAPLRRFINAYGPTEATVIATAYETAGEWESPVPMGTPAPNHRAHVVDADLDPVPVGVPGELLIGGPGLARGYLGEPALTAQCFVPDPFGDTPGARLYRTGDRVVWQPDGVLLFLGRADGQVKIRGQRVEVGEVEAALRTHPGIGFAVVLAMPGPAGQELVACCAPESGLRLDQLAQWCADRLTPAMIPARLVSMAELPLNASGKVDRVALRELAEARFEAAPVEDRARPQTPIQCAVAQAWHGLLGVPLDRVSLDDEFFAAGGHSIAAMRLVADVRRSLGRAITVEDVFAGRTVGEIARRVAEAPALSGADLPTGSPPALSAAQRRLWFIDQLAPDVSAYNIPMAQRLHGPLDVAALREALAAVAARHEVLRWRMPAPRGVPTVIVSPPEPVPLIIEDVSDLDAAARERHVTARLTATAAQRFDLANGPLWRAHLLRVADDEHILAITFQHAVFDGWSLRPYLTELGAAYAAARAGVPADLPPLPASFADYVAWREIRDAERGPADLAWWTGHLAGAPVVLDLPTDRPRPAVQTYPGAREVAELPRHVTRRLRDLATTLGVTMPAVLLAGFGQLCHRLTGATDMIVGTPAADRRHLDFHELVGFFIDIVPLRLRVAPATDFAGGDQRGDFAGGDQRGDFAGGDQRGDFAAAVRSATTELFDALAHPAAPLERIVDALGVPRDLRRSPLVQVLFNVYNFPDPHLELAGLDTLPVQPGLPGSPFDLTTYVVERGATFAVEMLYNTDLFDAARVRDMLEGYLRLLDELSAEPLAPSGGAWRRATPERTVASRPRGAIPASSAPGPAEPTGATELLVARAWCEILERDRVAATDNFFDIGGTSLAIVAVQARIAELHGRRVTLVDLFRYPNVRTLAGFLDGVGGQPEQTRGALRAAARRVRLRSRPTRPAASYEGETR